MVVIVVMAVVVGVSFRCRLLSRPRDDGRAVRYCVVVVVTIALASTNRSMLTATTRYMYGGRNELAVTNPASRPKCKCVRAYVRACVQGLSERRKLVAVAFDGTDEKSGPLGVAQGDGAKGPDGGWHVHYPRMLLASPAAAIACRPLASRFAALPRTPRHKAPTR